MTTFAVDWGRGGVTSLKCKRQEDCECPAQCAGVSTDDKGTAHFTDQLLSADLPLVLGGRFDLQAMLLLVGRKPCLSLGETNNSREASRRFKNQPQGQGSPVTRGFITTSLKRTFPWKACSRSLNAGSFSSKRDCLLKAS